MHLISPRFLTAALIATALSASALPAQARKVAPETPQRAVALLERACPEGYVGVRLTYNPKTSPLMTHAQPESYLPAQPYFVERCARITDPRLKLEDIREGERLVVRETLEGEFHVLGKDVWVRPHSSPLGLEGGTSAPKPAAVPSAVPPGTGEMKAD